MRRSCQRTCLKKGKDRWSRPFTHNEPVVVSTKKYPSRCAYYKERRLCKHGHYRFKVCRRTCQACDSKVPARYQTRRRRSHSHRRSTWYRHRQKTSTKNLIPPSRPERDQGQVTGQG